MRKYIYTFFGLVLLLACNDENDPIDSTPSTVQLIFPINNTECANNELTFIWNPAESPNGSPIIYNLYLSNNPNIDSDYEVYQTNNTQYTVSNIPRGHYVIGMLKQLMVQKVVIVRYLAFSHKALVLITSHLV